MAFLSFEQCVAEAWPPDDWRGVSVLVAVSGGPDSVALLRALDRLRQPRQSNACLVVAHFNHRLRPESDAEEAIVRQLAGQLGLPCEAARAEPASLDLGDGLEAAAREARYRFLQVTAERLGARYVAVGHTADDQVETILHHILRGTGLAGLAGMPRVRALSPAVTVIRPLLGLRRHEVEDYLRELGQPYCKDATNQLLHHTRNRIRHELLPLLTERFNAHVKDALLRLGGLAGEAQEVLSRLADDLARQRACELPGGGISVDCQNLADLPRYLVREMFCQVWRRHGWPLQDMTFRHWEALAEMTRAAQGDARVRQVFPGGILAHAERHVLRLSSSGDEAPRLAP
jgi:tRNA(Ile)-lysidine synthase